MRRWLLIVIALVSVPVSSCGTDDVTAPPQTELILLLDPTVLERGDSAGAARIASQVHHWIRSLPAGAILRVFKVGSDLTSTPPELVTPMPELVLYDDRKVLATARQRFADSVLSLYQRWWRGVHQPDSVRMHLSCIRSALYRVQRNAGTESTRRYVLLVSDLLESCQEAGLVDSMESALPPSLQSQLLASGGLGFVEALYVMQVQSQHVTDPGRDRAIRRLWSDLFVWLGVAERSISYLSSIGNPPWGPPN
jgi:hypothetical protein